jgi:hypothetical protein
LLCSLFQRTREGANVSKTLARIFLERLQNYLFNSSW